MILNLGKPAINPVLFYSGKISGYIVWVLLLMSLFSTNDLQQIHLQQWIAVGILGLGLVLTFISLLNLGNSTRLGLPKEATQFITKGLYGISRNPMYIGFNMFTLSAILFIANIFVLILGIYSIIIYHFIIKGEEAFLENRFKEAYQKYKKKVHRYI